MNLGQVLLELSALAVRQHDRVVRLKALDVVEVVRRLGLGLARRILEVVSIAPRLQVGEVGLVSVESFEFGLPLLRRMHLAHGKVVVAVRLAVEHLRLVAEGLHSQGLHQEEVPARLSARLSQVLHRLVEQTLGGVELVGHFAGHLSANTKLVYDQKILTELKLSNLRG